VNRRVLVIPLLMAALAGCSPTPPPSPPPSPTAAPATQATDIVNDSGFPVIPEGAVYSLYCMTITTPTHIPDSDRLKSQLIGRTGHRDWYVVHAEGQSKLYYGFYKTFADDNMPEEKQRAQSDRKAIAQLRDDNGDTPFAGCAFELLSGPDPQAPPEWDLRNAQGYWSLHIASYTGSPDRKKYAVDAVRQARAMGIEAYYYHGPSVSDVLVGAWPREAVKEQDASVASSNDVNKTIVVLSQPLPPNLSADNLRTRDGRPTKVFVPRVEVQDVTLLAAMKQYPANAVNGQVTLRKVPSDQGPIERPDPSFLVVIPHDPQEAQPPASAGNGG
jgi:hypothetical protein